MEASGALVSRRLHVNIKFSRICERGINVGHHVPGSVQCQMAPGSGADFMRVYAILCFNHLFVI
jgi:hypothetical protein